MRCLPRARDRFGRIACSVGNVADVGEVLVREGLAINFGGFAEGPYIDAETEARLAWHMAGSLRSSRRLEAGASTNCGLIELAGGGCS